MTQLIIIGGGLAGSEAAWQAAERGISVALVEMRPGTTTGAHRTGNLAELVCSNSLGSDLPDRASGVLKSELRRLGSLLMTCADRTAVPAGGALAVDRDAFAELVSQKLSGNPNIEIVREEAVSVPDGPAIIASGPLTSSRLSRAIAELSGEEHLFFFDAIAPVVSADSINMNIAFCASRYGRGEQDEGDYINCPFTREEYEVFVDALLTAERISLRSFEKLVESGVRAGPHHFFEGCLPIEILAQRGRDALAYGPMRPVGLTDPRTGRRPYAALQLRQDNLAASMYNLVGFQTNLKFPEQKRVFSLIPGLEKADFIKYGQMHRNTFIAAPKLLRPTLQWHDRDDLLFAGQLTGVEGYAGNIATGLLAGINMCRILNCEEPMVFPQTTMLGALCHYVTHADMKDFQPMKANFGILPQLANPPKGKRPRAEAYAERAKDALEDSLR
ncbi:MAG: methylenetetrahydrofolate--tRNA-(uracil(54)-C(5))-methyltransferase (FADH(2)-oxidizing) TrmFO [Verrucomicrobia bacterium]|nr:methylenetetrahydrofolate--tRNA-(uracil(54)-C(5))-methyltransferase (FADH(2)-oxidizing) TrmFO [Verrucomicrobiota bacterium]